MEIIFVLLVILLASFPFISSSIYFTHKCKGGCERVSRLKEKKLIVLSITAWGLVALFLVFILLIRFIDVKPSGAQNSMIGLSTLNLFFFELLGENTNWDKITDLLMLFSIAVAGIIMFAVVNQFVKRKNIKKINENLFLFVLILLALGICYIVFEWQVVNYRPILVDGELEASFPSSHTLLVCTLLGCAIYQVKNTINNIAFKIITYLVFALSILLTVVGRLLAGVHWFTDVLGGVILSSALVMLYIFSCELIKSKKQIQKDNE